jgi:hypothetical protein
MRHKLALKVLLIVAFYAMSYLVYCTWDDVDDPNSACPEGREENHVLITYFKKEDIS